MYLAALKTEDHVDQQRAQKKISNAQQELAAIKELADSGALYGASQNEINRIVEASTETHESYVRAVERLNRASIDAAMKAARKKEETDLKIASQDAIHQTEAAYQRLTRAQNEYVSAVRDSNETRQVYWQSEIDNSKAVLAAIDSVVEGMDISAEAKEKIIQIVKDAEQAELKHRDAVDETRRRMDEQRKSAEQAEANIRNMAAQAERWLATMIVMRGLTNVWSEMTEYAASYYDAMNEIRIVTGDTIEETNKMGASYRAMAQEMSVTSTEIAKAAVEYWRQGLNEDQVNERLRYTTAYAKISAMDFNTAAELMTAATNAMEISASRVADVWTYLGDASAAG